VFAAVTEGLLRLVLDYRSGELVVRCLYHTEGGAGPNTKARRREISELVRTGADWLQGRAA